jgi:hypothetical protein
VHTAIAEPVFVNLLRSPGIDSRFGGIDSSELITGLLKRLQTRALSTTPLPCMSCTWGGRLERWPQHGSPPGWLEESDSPRRDLCCDCDGRSMPPSPGGPYCLPWSGAAWLWASSKSRCSCWCFSTECMYTKHRHELNHARKAWVKSLVRPLPSALVSHISVTVTYCPILAPCRVANSQGGFISREKPHSMKMLHFFFTLSGSRTFVSFWLSVQCALVRLKTPETRRSHSLLWVKAKKDNLPHPSPHSVS